MARENLRVEIPLARGDKTKTYKETHNFFPLLLAKNVLLILEREKNNRWV